ncbi:MAG: FixH family protein, partial [bacterium]|nr:FixH family protein [bacterium]
MKLVLTAVILIALAAVAGTIVVGSRTFDGVVTEGSYEKGLNWDRDREASLGWRAVLTNSDLAVGKNDIALAIIDPEGKDRTDTLRRVTRTRPASDRYDHDYPVAASNRRPVSLVIEFPLHGRWVL